MALLGVQLPRGERFLDVLLTAWDAGDAVLPIAPDLPEPELRRLLHATRPARLLVPSGEVRLHDPAPVDGDVALVIATSGTTSEPKAVELAHAAVTASVRAGLERIGGRGGDVWLCCLPLHHVAGILVLLRSLHLGTAPVVHAAFDPAAIAADDRATHVALVPTMLRRLLDARVDLSRFERILLGGAAAPPPLLREAASAGARVTTTYGMTETCGGCVYDGRPLDGVEVRVGDDGRIAVRGAVLMRRYRLRPDLTAAAFHDGWFATADLGRIDRDGRLQVLGRADDVIVTGGELVVASRVAALLAEHPKVAEAAVAGRDDAEWGQRVVAFCVPADPARPPTLEELRSWVAERTAANNAPRELEVVEHLPRTALGKVARPRPR